MNPIMLTAIGVGGSTIIGSLLGFLIKRVSHRTNDTIIGLCAGIMLSAAILGLMEPAFDMCPSWSRVWWPCLGVVAGLLLLNVLDSLTPHLHQITGIE